MILVTAHRGFSGVAPENTMAAFEEAVGLHPDAVEFDIHACKDGRLVVIHDKTLERTTDGSGSVADKTLEELKSLDAGSWKAPRYANQRIPTFREALELLKGRVAIWVELKHEGIEKQFLDEVKAAGVLDQVAVTSFHERALIRLKELEPTIPTALNRSPKTDAPFVLSEEIRQVLRARANAFSIRHDVITRELVAEAKRHGIAVWSWTVDEPEDIERMVELDVDFITSNFPDRVLKILGQKGELSR